MLISAGSFVTWKGKEGLLRFADSSRQIMSRLYFTITKVSKIKKKKFPSLDPINQMFDSFTPLFLRIFLIVSFDSLKFKIFHR